MNTATSSSLCLYILYCSGFQYVSENLRSHDHILINQHSLECPGFSSSFRIVYLGFFFPLVLFLCCFLPLPSDMLSPSSPPTSLLTFLYSAWQIKLLCHWLSFFLFFFISWRLITLQYCSGFCHTLKWISRGFTCVPHPDPRHWLSNWSLS